MALREPAVGTVTRTTVQLGLGDLSGDLVGGGGRSCVGEADTPGR